MNISIQNGWILSLLFLLASYPPWLLLYKKGVKRLTNFNWIHKKEKNLSLILLILFIVTVILPIFYTITTNSTQLFIGIFIFSLGVIFTHVSYYNYMTSDDNKLITKGLYNVSRNPIYVSTLLMIIGIIVLCNLYLMIFILLLYLVLQHPIIREEERFCSEQYKEDFEKYRKRVRRYL